MALAPSGAAAGHRVDLKGGRAMATSYEQWDLAMPRGSRGEVPGEAGTIFATVDTPILVSREAALRDLSQKIPEAGRHDAAKTPNPGREARGSALGEAALFDRVSASSCPPGPATARAARACPRRGGGSA